MRLGCENTNLAMRQGGGKQKGAGFERDVCKDLSLWVSDNSRVDLFWRSAMSGGRATVAKKRSEEVGNQGGDITALGGIGEYSKLAAALTSKYFIECKFVKSLEYHRLVTAEGFVLKVWDVAKASCSEGRSPLLILKENFGARIVVFDEALFFDLEYLESLGKYMTVQKATKIGIMLFDDFLKCKAKKLMG